MRGEFTCQDCKDRYPGCHDHCAKYQYAKQKHTEARHKEISDNIRTTGFLMSHRVKFGKFTQNGI